MNTQAVIILLLFSVVTGQNLNQVLNNTGQDANIERPCDVFDTRCIRRYFVQNGNCEPAYGPVPDPFRRERSKTFLSTVNVTADLLNVWYGGLNGRIEEFYVNRETDKVVLEVAFRNLSISSRNAYFRFHRRAREPIVTKDSFYIKYRSVSSTMVIPQRKNLQLQKGEQFMFIEDALPQIYVGPRIFGNPDPVVQTAGREYFQYFPQILMEALATEGSFYMATFIQYTLCDFGLKIL